MARTLFIAGLAGVVLSACSQSPKAKIEARCLADGEDKAACSCIAEQADKNLNSDQMEMLATVIDNEGDANAVLGSLGNMSLSDARAMLSAMEQIAESCGAEF